MTDQPKKAVGIGVFLPPIPYGLMTSFCGGGYLEGNPDGSWTRVAEDGTKTIFFQKEPE